jgi:PKD repeat protein
MKKIFTLALALLTSVSFAQLSSDSATYVNAIGVQDIGGFPNLNSVSSCADTLSVTIPAGNWVYGVDVFYTIETVGGFFGGMPPSGISGYLQYLNTGAKETQLYAGTINTNGATEALSRFNIPLANGVNPSGQLDFSLHKFDQAFFSTGCDTADAKIQAGSWKIVVHHAPPPTCLKPTALGVNFVMHNRAELNWQTGGAANWQVEYGAAGFATGSGTLLAVSSTPFVLNGLSASTNYEFYVRDSCAAGDVSLWEGPFAFSTLCNPLTFATSYTEDFEGATWVAGNGNTNANNTLEGCWTRDPAAPTGGGGPFGGGAFAWGTGTGGTPTANTGPSAAQAGTKYIYVEATGGANQDVATITSPLIDLSSLTVPAVEFYYHRYGAAVGEVKLQAWSISQGWQDVWTQSGTENQSANTDPWIQETVVLNAFANDTVQLRFRAVRSFQAQGDIAIDELEVKEAPNCPKPSAFAATASTTSSISFSWNSSNASSWEIEYGAPGFTLGTGTSVVVNSNPGTVTGLAIGQTFEFYLRSICSATDTSAWSNPVIANTLCNSVAAPFLEDFDGAGWTAGTGVYNAGDALGSCWFRTPAAGTAAVDPVYWGTRSTPTSTPNTGPDADNSGTGNFVYLESSAGSFGQQAYLESPFIDLSALTIPELTFYYHMFGNTMGTLSVDVYSGSTSSWTIGLFSISGAQQFAGADAFVKGIVSLAAFANDSVIIRFVGAKGNERRSDMALDEVRIEETPVCPQPANLISSNLSATSVDLSWTTGGATNWNIEYGPSGFTLGTGTIVNVNTNPFTLTLGANQVYDIYVRDSCGVGSVSLWAGPETVTMPCGLSTLPFAENFDGNLWTSGFGGGNNGNAISSCWTRPSNANPNFGTRNGNTNSAGTGPNGDFSGNGNYLYTEASGSAGAGSITSPQIVMTANISSPTLKFYYHMFGSGIDSLYVEINNGSGWTQIYSVVGAQQNANADAWILVQQSISSYTGDTVRIRFTGVNNSFPGDIAIDEVAIEDIACPQSSNFIITGETSSSIDLSWVSGGSAGQIIEYGPTGFAPGSGTSISFTASPATISGLTSATTYDFYLQDSCGATNLASLIGPITASTLCSFFTAPYTENFDDTTWVVGDATNNNVGNLINACWTRPSDANPNLGSFTGATPSANTGPNSDAGGSGKYIYAEYSGGVTAPGEINSPEIYIPSTIASPIVEFGYFMFGGAVDSLVVLAVQGSATTRLGSIAGSQQTATTDPWLYDDFSLSAFSGDTLVIRLLAYSTGGFTGDIAIDDFAVKDLSCPKPTALTSTGVTKNSVTLSWTTGGATNWQIEYGPVGFFPGQGTLVVATTNPFTVTGLNASTYYSFFVRDSCAVGDVSSWVGPYTTPTSCDTVLAPYTENFDVAFDPGTNPAGAQNVGSTISPCWSRDSDSLYFWGGGTGATPTGGTGPFGDNTSGNGNYAYIESSFAPAASTAWLETPHINLDSLTFPEIRFWYHMWAQNGTQGTLVWEVDSGNGVWNSLGSHSGNQGFQWIEQVTDIRAYVGTTIKLRFRATVGNGATTQQGDIAIDDLSIADGLSCPAPDSLQLVSRTSSTLSVDWVTGSASDFNITWQAVGSTSVVTANATTSAFAPSGLSAQTSYVVCVRDSCGPGNVSVWVCDTFQTLCSPLVAPYAENFDGAGWTSGAGGQNNGNVINACWDRPAGNPNLGTRTGTTGSAATGPDTDFSGSGNYIYSEYSGVNANEGIIYSPLISLPTSFANPELSYSYHMYGANIDSLQVAVESGGSSSYLWSAIGAQQTNNSDAWLTTTINMNAYSGDTIRLLFRAFGSGFASDIAIDEVDISSVSCPAPTAFTITGVTTTTISYSHPNLAANAEIQYGAPGFTPGTGTSTVIPGATSSATGLNAGTYYEFYVRNICAPGDTSSWFGPVLTNTNCGVSTAPYFENFDFAFNEGTGGQNAGSTISPCWSNNSDSLYHWGGGSGGTPSNGTGPNGDRTSGAGSYVYVEASGGASGDTAILETPSIDLSALTQPELVYWLHMFTANGAPISLEVEILDNGTWTSLETITGSQTNAWLERRLNLSSYANQTISIRFTSIKATGNVAFQGDIAIDDISIDEVLSCAPVYMPYAENFDSNVWQEGTGATNANDQIDPCWTRATTALNTWGAGTGATPSNNTGPTSDLSGSGNYLYMEASRGRAVATISSPSIIIDATSNLPYLYYSYHMYGATIVNFSIEVDNGSPVLLRTILGQQQTSGAAAWISDSIDLSAYKGDTINFNFLADATTFTGDVALDGIEVREAAIPCVDPTTLVISNETQTSVQVDWVSANPAQTVLTYYELTAGPGTMTVLTGLSSPYVLGGLVANSQYQIGVYDSCSASLFSGAIFDTALTAPCDTVTAIGSATSSYYGASFNGSSSVNADTLVWDFGDLTTGGGFNPNHVYGASGLYTITLMAYNDCGTGDTISFSLLICDTLTPQLATTVQIDSLFFDASGSNATGFAWDFGDGGTDTNRTGAYQYAASGTYTVTLTVFNDCGDTLSTTQNITVCGAPKADWTYTILSPVGTGLRIQFDATASTNAVNYNWDFGDGTTGTGVNPIHIYTTPGLFYQVKLEVTNSCGDKDDFAFVLSSISTEEWQLKDALQIYPNPTSGLVRIEWPSEEVEIQNIQVLDSKGALMFEADVKEQKDLYTLDMNNLDPGMYFIRVLSNKGNSNTPLIKVD